MPRTLPPRQFGALAILAAARSLTVSAVARSLRCDATSAKNALNLLAYKGLATALDTAPITYQITAEGRAALTAELKPGA